RYNIDIVLHWGILRSDFDQNHKGFGKINDNGVDAKRFEEHGIACMLVDLDNNFRDVVIPFDDYVMMESLVEWDRDSPKMEVWQDNKAIMLIKLLTRVVAIMEVFSFEFVNYNIIPELICGHSYGHASIGHAILNSMKHIYLIMFTMLITQTLQNKVNHPEISLISSHMGLGDGIKELGQQIARGS
ncbi:hypothetical protein ACJX0J_015921, partial [Zea mays]